MTGAREILGGMLIVAGLVLVMYCLIWAGARLAHRAMQWADERDARSEADRSG